MAGPSSLADALAAVMIATSAYCMGRLVTSWRQQRPGGRDVDAVHVLMGVAMAGMLVPRLRVFWAGGWEVVFGAAAAWFAWHALRGLGRPAGAGRQQAHHLQHLLACVAMVYMLLAVTSARAAAPAGPGPGAAMPGGAARLPTLTLALVLALLGYVVWTADQLTSPATLDVGTTCSGRYEGRPVTAGDLALTAAGPVPAAQGSDPEDADPKDGPSRDRTPQRRLALSPRLAACCEIAMGVTMGYMLIIML